jgi:high-affinity Fe2+/Pb2+ permease
MNNYDLLIIYFGSGLIVCGVLDFFVYLTGNRLNNSERITIMVLWPLMLLVFMFSFFSGMFNDDSF